jgi:predicted AlkP superfamily phosphohydrolase/phosphomutase
MSQTTLRRDTVALSFTPTGEGMVTLTLKEVSDNRPGEEFWKSGDCHRTHINKEDRKEGHIDAFEEAEKILSEVFPDIKGTKLNGTGAKIFKVMREGGTFIFMLEGTTLHPTFFDDTNEENKESGG